MTRFLAWLTRWLVRDIYVVVDCGKVIDVSARLQGAELIRIDWARKWVRGIPNPDTAARVERMVYNRQRIQHFALRDVS